MTAAEKAKELFNKYYVKIQESDKYCYLLNSEEKDLSKECAIICVDEILNTVSELHVIADSEGILVSMKYWEQVKEEINAI